MGAGASVVKKRRKRYEEEILWAVGDQYKFDSEEGEEFNTLWVKRFGNVSAAPVLDVFNFLKEDLDWYKNSTFYIDYDILGYLQTLCVLVEGSNDSNRVILKLSLFIGYIHQRYYAPLPKKRFEALEELLSPYIGKSIEGCPLGEKHQCPLIERSDVLPIGKWYETYCRRREMEKDPLVVKTLEETV
mmetsp:Transcript_9135/g.13506  ORF Transcript_9135/g.13506 Transcript_9135/m.13506 type:complete len:187 (+) Transcript_9135:71-631(+)